MVIKDVKKGDTVLLRAIGKEARSGERIEKATVATVGRSWKAYSSELEIQEAREKMTLVERLDRHTRWKRYPLDVLRHVDAIIAKATL